MIKGAYKNLNASNLRLTRRITRNINDDIVNRINALDSTNARESNVENGNNRRPVEDIDNTTTKLYF